MSLLQYESSPTAERTYRWTALGHPSTCYNSVRSLRRRGKHIQVGLLLGETAEAAIPMSDVIAYELEILGSHGMQAHRYGAMLDLLKSGKLNPSRLVGKQISLEESIPELMNMDSFQSVGATVVNRFAP